MEIIENCFAVHAIAGYARIIKTGLRSRQGCSTNKITKAELVTGKNSAAWGQVMSLICFIVVLLPLMPGVKLVVLEDAYISSQRNHLENIIQRAR